MRVSEFCVAAHVSLQPARRSPCLDGLAVTVNATQVLANFETSGSDEPDITTVTILTITMAVDWNENNGVVLFDNDILGRVQM